MMSNSKLASYINLSPNRGNYFTEIVNGAKTQVRKDGRTNTIKKITIHHAAGVASAATIVNLFASASRGASCNYAIGNDGSIGLCVEESNRAWTSSSAANDNQAVTIEVSNSETGGQWRISDKAMASLIDLCVDICKRNNIKKLNWTGDASGNLTVHRFFAATVCPGEYLMSKMPWIASEVNRRLKETEEVEITYQSFFNRWGAEISSKTNSYSGDSDRPISGIRAKTNIGKIYIQSRLINGAWLGKQSKYVKDGGSGTGYSGAMYNAIDGFRVFVEDTDASKVEYRAHWCGKNGQWGRWIKASESNNTFAGMTGYCIDGVQIRVVK